MIMIPIEIINKILVYISELNNNMIITQYCPITYKEFYKINFNSDLLLEIKTACVLKHIYPIYNYKYFCNNYNRQFYKSGINHYKEQLKIKKS